MDKNLLQYDGSKRVLAIVGALTVAQTVAIITQALFLAKAITQMFHGASFTDVSVSFALFFLAHVIRHTLQWAKERVSYRFAERTAHAFREQLVEQIFELGPQAVGQHGSGNLVTLTIEGIPKFRKYLELFIPRVTAMAVIPAIVVLFVFTKDILSGVILVIVLPVLILFLILIGIVSKRRIDDQMETYRLLSRHFVDSLRGLVTLKYLGRSKSHEKAIETVSNKYRIATNRALRYAFLSSFALDFFASLSVAIVAVELGFRLINGGVGLEMALAVLILAPEYFTPVRELGNDFHATVDGQDAGNEIRAILATPRTTNEGAVAQLHPASSIALQDVGVAGDEGRAILQGINLTTTGAQKIGIVGSSGAGKSTLIQALAGFVPTTGQTVVDGAPAVFTQDGWRQQISYVPQHPTIFSASVLDNIRFYAPQASEQAVIEAAKTVGLYSLIMSFPAQFNEVIGQGGRVLSGGEEQRIALARTLLQQQPLLLFDEPTAHLDIETEHDIKEIIVPMLEGKTVFFATHRLHWMQNMDYIVVLDQGQIVEQGTHDELLAKKGAYVALRQAQRGVSA